MNDERLATVSCVLGILTYVAASSLLGGPMAAAVPPGSGGGETRTADRSSIELRDSSQLQGIVRESQTPSPDFDGLVDASRGSIRATSP